MSHDALLSSLVQPAVSLTFAEVNLDEAARAVFRPDAPNPLRDLRFKADWINHLARSRGARMVYGGYLEDRAFLHRGTYLDAHPGRAVHLGIDVWFPGEAVVYCPVSFMVEQAWHDPDQDGGWGGRLTVRTVHGRVVFAHLLIAYGLEAGQSHPAGTRIGYVCPAQGEEGRYLGNGGWTPHLHLQGLADEVSLDGLDGYGPLTEDTSRLYPNPLDILSSV